MTKRLFLLATLDSLIHSLFFFVIYVLSIQNYNFRNLILLVCCNFLGNHIGFCMGNLYENLYPYKKRLFVSMVMVVTIIVIGAFCIKFLNVDLSYAHVIHYAFLVALAFFLSIGHSKIFDDF